MAKNLKLPPQPGQTPMLRARVCAGTEEAGPLQEVGPHGLTAQLLARTDPGWPHSRIRPPLIKTSPHASPLAQGRLPRADGH